MAFRKDQPPSQHPPTPAWTPDLLVGHTRIDEQHKRIFQAMHDLQDAIGAGQGAEEVGKVMATLSMFVVAHFRMEEALMAQYGYPGLADHQEAHKLVRFKVEHMVDRFHQGRVDPLELATFMQWWLHDHVQKEDQPLAAFLSSMEGAAG